MIEAMACGTPVVASAHGSVPEVVDVGMTGYHDRAEDGLPALVPMALQLDRRAVREHAMERFDVRRMTDRYVELYREVILNDGPLAGAQSSGA